MRKGVVIKTTGSWHYVKLGDGEIVPCKIKGKFRTHPIAKMNVKILGVQTASELGEVIAAVGLAQNLAALRALAVEGIQRGHMKLHARNVAMEAGATGEMIDVIAKKMVQDKKIRLERAKQLLTDFRQ